MKTIFSIMMIFLFLSCGGGKKTPESVIPDEDSVSDSDITEVDESDAGAMPDADEDAGIEIEPCGIRNPCKGVEHSTGECTVNENAGYVCSCEKGYAWFGEEEGCLSIKNFYGSVCTGQTKCFDMEKEIPCPKDGEPFYGQDAQYAKMGKCVQRNYSVKKYDEGESVIDNNTGLEWERGSLTGNYGYYDGWYHCIYLEIGGKGWRLPSPKEQRTIIDADYYDPVVNGNYFPDTYPGFFYSDDFQVNAYFQYRQYSATGVDFRNGLTEIISGDDISGGMDCDDCSFRCVRTVEQKGSCNSIFYDSGETGIVVSPSRDLIFQKDSNVAKNWSDALDYCENLTYAGISDWRLPNKNEIQYLSDFNNLWTSTTSAGNPAEAWYFGTFELAYSSKEQKRNVRCVTENPCGEGNIWTGEKCVPFADFGLDDAGCGCKYRYGWDWEKRQCVEQCGVELCKQAEHSNGECALYTESSDPKYYCQCEDNYFYNGKECVSPCDEEPCKDVEGGDGTCTAKSTYKYKCGCTEDYFAAEDNADTGSRYDVSCIAFSLSCTSNHHIPCKNKDAKLMWAGVASQRLILEDAKKYCADFDAYGHDDWRLPTVDEFRTLESDCESVKPDGECEASEKAGCLSVYCARNCDCKNHNSGDVWYWSSSLVSGNHENAFAMYEDNSVVIKQIADSGFARCVRDLE